MMRNIGFLALLTLMINCNSGVDTDLIMINEMVMEVRQKYAPDKRVAIFNVKADRLEKQILLSGESNIEPAIEELNGKVLKSGILAENKITLLIKSNGIINISVANLRSNPKHSAELATQALLGMPVNIWKEQDDWCLVQTPDNYLAWTDADALVKVSAEEMEGYHNKEKVIFIKPFGFVKSSTKVNATKVSDITIGDMLEFLDESGDYFKVKFPDGREGFVLKSESSFFGQWLREIEPSGDALVNQAFDFMGVPYLWGGTSFKGVDCSGFTKMVYLMNGRVIPRDASQQVHTGIEIDDKKDFSQLSRGDLLFFGSEATDSAREKVTHVALWIGDNKYIHSAGKVKINSMDQSDPLFSQKRFDTYLRTKRILNHESDGIKLLNNP